MYNMSYIRPLNVSTMAMQKGNNYSGVAGAVVFFTRNGKQGVRARPAKVKQTKGMKANHTGFGRAARIGSHLRSGLNNFVPNYKDPALMYALNDCVRKWLMYTVSPAGTKTAGFASLEGFELNAQALLKEKLRLYPTVDWSDRRKILVHIPALVPADDIAAPPYPAHNTTKTIRWYLRAVDVTLGDRPHLEDFADASITLPYNSREVAAQTVSLEMAVKAKHLVVVFLRQVYVDGGDEEIVDERWQCGAIIGAKH